MKLLVKYCGGCNPAYDRVALVKQIFRYLATELPDWQMVYQGSDNDGGLMVCGCDACCVDRDENKGSIKDWIVVGPDMVNYYQVPGQDIPAQVVKLIKNKV